MHSMKDVPTWLVDGTILPCTLPREDTRDAWISPSGKLPQDLPDGAAACRHHKGTGFGQPQRHQGQGRG